MKLPLRMLTAPTENRISPELIRSKFRPPSPDAGLPRRGPDTRQLERPRVHPLLAAPRRCSRRLAVANLGGSQKRLDEVAADVFGRRRRSLFHIDRWGLAFTRQR